MQRSLSAAADNFSATSRRCCRRRSSLWITPMTVDESWSDAHSLYIVYTYYYSFIYLFIYLLCIKAWQNALQNIRRSSSNKRRNKNKYNYERDKCPELTAFRTLCFHIHCLIALGDSDVISFHIYVRWFSPPSCEYTLRNICFLVVT